MFNSITERKIRNLPTIGEINIEELPKELTRIYAEIVSIRRNLTDGQTNFDTGAFSQSLETLQTLSCNLETILVLYPDHAQKESIAFVAGTAHALIHKIGSFEPSQARNDFDFDTISPIVSATVLFLIGNSQADAAEISDQLFASSQPSAVKRNLARAVNHLAKGEVLALTQSELDQIEIDGVDATEIAVEYLFLELLRGVIQMAKRLTGIAGFSQIAHFEKVISLSVQEGDTLGLQSAFTGPYHLAKLLRILDGDILKRALINVPAPVNTDAYAWDMFIKKVAESRPYLWENHIDAIDSGYLNPGVSSVLTLPTGSGKSTLSELKIAACLLSKKTVVYLVPTHALEAQVVRNLRVLFSELNGEYYEIGAEFTDLGFAEELSVSVMTPERCLTLLNMDPERFRSVGLIAFDEFHLIHGTGIEDRRAIDAMYCLLSLLEACPNADYLLISAMVSNGDAIQNWIASTTGRPCLLFNSSWKPTRQLHGCLVYQEADLDGLNHVLRTGKASTTIKGIPKKVQAAMALEPYCFFCLKNAWDTTESSDYHSVKLIERHVQLSVNKSWRLTSNRNGVAASLAVHYAKMGLKTLVFVSTPQTAYATAKKVNAECGDIKNSDDFRSKNRKLIADLETELGDLDVSYFEECSTASVHHGLLLPQERILIEKFFKDQEGCPVLVATATLAQGINLPAEIVIIAGDDKFDQHQQSMKRMSAHELLNAAGRAGRAGQSSQGAVIVIPGETVSIKGTTISRRWWSLKDEVFSKSDQCLEIMDPLEALLDSLQDDSEPLTFDQINILYKFKSESISETETRKLFSKSFHKFQIKNLVEAGLFDRKVQGLLNRRKELETISADINWIQEASFKTGIDPGVILELGNAIRDHGWSEFDKYSITQLIGWYLGWLSDNPKYVGKIFLKNVAVNELKKFARMAFDEDFVDYNSLDFSALKKALLGYVKGSTVVDIDRLIFGKETQHRQKARTFIIKLIPELSFAFGLFAMTIVEIATQDGEQRQNMSPNIRVLASCIREGFDDVKKMYFRYRHGISSRVAAHRRYDLESDRPKA